MAFRSPPHRDDPGETLRSNLRSEVKLHLFERSGRHLRLGRIQMDRRNAQTQLSLQGIAGAAGQNAGARAERLGLVEWLNLYMVLSYGDIRDLASQAQFHTRILRQLA